MSKFFLKFARVILPLVVSGNLYSQQAVVSQATEKTKSTEKGDILLDIYYGYPNLYANLLEKEAIKMGIDSYNQSRGLYSTISITSVKAFGTIGGKAEYLLTDLIGGCVEFNYSNLEIDYTRQVNNGYVPGVTTYNYRWYSPAYRIMMGFNFHVVKTSSLDFYCAIKGGYYNRTFSFWSDEPGYRVIASSPAPVAFRMETGIRYFFSDMIGVHVNLGLGGGPIVAGGISVRL